MQSWPMGSLVKLANQSLDRLPQRPGRFDQGGHPIGRRFFHSQRPVPLQFRVDDAEREALQRNDVTPANVGDVDVRTTTTEETLSLNEEKMMVM